VDPLDDQGIDKPLAGGALVSSGAAPGREPTGAFELVHGFQYLAGSCAAQKTDYEFIS
jgi:hypothetical protein